MKRNLNMTEQTLGAKAIFARFAATGLLASSFMFSVVAAPFLLQTSAAHAQEEANAIESIVANQQGALTILRFQMKAPLKAPPGGFSIANPARIALDFPATTNAIGKNLLEISQGELRNINVVQAGERARVVLNLKRTLAYQTSIQGNVLTVTLDPRAPAAALASAPVTTRFAEGKINQQGHAVREIDFRRGSEGEGRIIVDLSDSDTGVDIRTQGSTLVLDFLKASLPQSLRRRLDVSDFATPVRTVNAFQQGDNVRIVIEPTGLWEHSAYQSDNRFVLEVKQIKEDPNKLVQGSRKDYKGEKLSLNFQNIEVRALLQVIADFTNLNIIASETVTGNITLRLKDVPWDQALDIIMQAKGLDMRKNGNVVLIGPRDELTTKEKLEYEAKQQIRELEPLRTESFQLNYDKAERFIKILTDDKQRILSKRGSAVIDPRTNKLFIQDIPSKLDEIRNLITQTDIPLRQVLIEARIVEADDKFSKSLGAKVGFLNQQLNDTAGTSIGGSQRIAVTGNYLGVGEQTGQARITDQSFIPNTQFVSLPASSINGVGPASFAVSLFKSGALRFLNLELSALEADGRGKIVSSPRIVTADNIEATIEQGEEIPYREATSSGAASIAFKKAVMSLKVTPQITPEGNVVLTVYISKDSRGTEDALGVPSINTKKIQTQVMVENGGTVVIGGIYQQIERNQSSKVPLLGDIPVLGYLFKNSVQQNDKTELLIFLTPKVLSSRLSVADTP